MLVGSEKECSPVVAQEARTNFVVVQFHDSIDEFVALCPLVGRTHGINPGGRRVLATRANYGAVGHQHPRIFVTGADDRALTHRGPLERGGCGIEPGDIRIEVGPQEKRPVGKHDAGSIADVCPGRTFGMTGESKIVQVLATGS